jgi:hypothetical protein
MITIPFISENGTLRPQRILSAEEWATVAFVACDGIEMKYYQRGEPLPEIPVSEGIKEKESLVNIDIDTLPQSELQKLAARLKPLINDTPPLSARP